MATAIATCLFQFHDLERLIFVQHEDGDQGITKLTDTASRLSFVAKGACVGDTYNCRHMPQGEAGGAMSVETAMAQNFRKPDDYPESARMCTPGLRPTTAAPSATRSAQLPTG